MLTVLVQKQQIHQICQLDLDATAQEQINKQREMILRCTLWRFEGKDN